MAVFLIILLILWLLWPYIMRWLRGYMTRRAEDMVRRMAGQPTRKEQQKAERQRRRNRRKEPQYHPDRQESHPARAMREVAEDVQYTEVKDFSESTLDFERDDKSSHTEFHESQVEDARYTEIKTKQGE